MFLGSKDPLFRAFKAQAPCDLRCREPPEAPVERALMVPGDATTKIPKLCP